MGAIWLYFILLLLSTIISWKVKSNSLGKTLLIIYSALATFAIFVPNRGSLRYVSKLDATVVTYPIVVFMILAYLLYFSPFLHKDIKFNVSKLQFSLNRNYIIFSYIFIACALVYILLYIRPVIGLLRGGDWANNRLLMLSDKALYPDSNIFEHIAILFVNYFQLLALIVSFLLVRDRSYRGLGITLLILTTGCEFCNDIYVSSRGMLAQFALVLLALYLFFYVEIEQSNRRIINIMIIVLGLTFGSFLVAVTFSRFSNQIGNSLVYYFGQPPYVFALETKNLKEPMLGRFAFGVLWGDEKYLNTYSNWDHMFYTFLGWIYADWDYIGVVLIGIFCALFFGSIIRKKWFNISDMYLLLAYYKMLVQGAFTIGRTRCYELFATILIYLLLRYVIDKYIFVFGKKDSERLKRSY